MLPRLRDPRRSRWRRRPVSSSWQAQQQRRQAKSLFGRRRHRNVCRSSPPRSSGVAARYCQYRRSIRRRGYSDQISGGSSPISRQSRIGQDRRVTGIANSRRHCVVARYAVVPSRQHVVISRSTGTKAHRAAERPLSACPPIPAVHENNVLASAKAGPEGRQSRRGPAGARASDNKDAEWCSSGRDAGGGCLSCRRSIRRPGAFRMAYVTSSKPESSHVARRRHRRIASAASQKPTAGVLRIFGETAGAVCCRAPRPPSSIADGDRYRQRSKLVRLRRSALVQIVYADDELARNWLGHFKRSDFHAKSPRDAHAAC